MIDFSNIRRALLIAYIIALLAVTLAPVPGSMYPQSGFDKLVHVVLFGTVLPRPLEHDPIGRRWVAFDVMDL